VCSRNLFRDDESGNCYAGLPNESSWFAVGSLSSDSEGEVAELLRFSGAVDIVNNILATKWMKLLSNATTGLHSYIGLSIHEAAAVPEMLALMVHAAQEELDVGASLGHPVLPIFGLKTDDNRLVDTLLDILLSGF